MRRYLKPPYLITKRPYKDLVTSKIFNTVLIIAIDSKTKTENER